jgi:multidrug efflux pump subunit AcrB
METEARKIMPQGYGIDYTGQSRQLRLEGNSFLSAFLMAITMIFLVLAAQFNSFRDPWFGISLWYGDRYSFHSICVAVGVYVVGQGSQ